jgi:tRNA threonylcarbamoyladenosine biosynthesis protein TsaB
LDKRAFTTTTEPIIFALDTSSKVTSLAVRQGIALLRSINSPMDEKRSDKLWSDVQRLLAELDLKIAAVDVFSVCVGPGSFTGLRVGMAAVKGFAAALNKPVVAVTSLEAVAFSVRPAVAVCAMVNAYRSEVYSQLFSFDGDGVPVAKNDPIVSSRDRALERGIDVNGLVFAGDGTEAGGQIVVSNGLTRREGNPAIKVTDHCLAEDIATLAFLKLARGQFETAGTLRACYVQPAAAEIKLSLGLLGSKIKRSMKSE